MNTFDQEEESGMKSREELHQQLRQRVLGLSAVTERQNTGIHEDAFLSGEPCSCTFMAMGVATFD
jgi:hypothetical protein